MKSHKSLPAPVRKPPTLFQQGVVFLCVFIFLQALFFGMLWWARESAEAESRREEHFKKILAVTQAMFRQSNAAIQQLKMHVKTKDAGYLHKYQSNRQQVLEALIWLKENLAQNKECLEKVNGIGDQLQTIIGVLDKARVKCELISNENEASEKFNHLTEAIQADFMMLLIDGSDLSAREEQMVTDIHLRAQREKRSKIIAVSIGGLIVFVWLGVYVFSFYVKRVTGRLLVMVDDTHRFKRGEELNTLLDVTDLHTTELNVAFHDMASEVREAQRMRQTFVAMISHDLRTPLTSVQGYLELVSLGAMGDASDKVVKGAGMAEQNVGRLIRLINDLLDLEKMEAGKMQMSPKVVYIESVIEKSISAIQEFAKQHEVLLKAEDTDAEVLADPDRLIQVIVNLASNAIKFSPKGETVEIRTIEGDSFIELQVIDRGRGVPAEYRETIFEKYKQVKTEDGTKKGGTGLGLPICKLIIEQLGGSIGVMSEDGKGSTFWFKLPKVSADAQPTVISLPEAEKRKA